jgi:pimeloyl-ACP methyl ester carboxylesterase
MGSPASLKTMRPPIEHPEDAVLDVDGPLHVSVWEGDPGRTFLCLPGLGGSAASWLPVGGGLSAHGRVVAVELPGTGRTPRAGRGSTLEDHRRVLSDVVARQSGDIVLVGNSLGGTLALLQAATEPSSIAGVVLTDPALPVAWGGFPSPIVVAGFGAYLVPGVGEWIVRTRLSGGVAERMVALGLRLCADDPSSIDAEVVRAHVDIVRSMQRDPDMASAFVESARSLLRLGMHPRRCEAILAGIRSPALLLHGAKDRFVPLRFAEAAAERHPRLELRVFPDLGHVPQLEAPDRWLRAVESWLSRSGLEVSPAAESGARAVR